MLGVPSILVDDFSAEAEVSQDAIGTMIPLNDSKMVFDAILPVDLSEIFRGLSHWPPPKQIEAEDTLENPLPKTPAAESTPQKDPFQIK